MIKSKVTTSLFFGAATVFAAIHLPLAAIAFGWLGGIRLLNAAAPKLAFRKVIHWAHAMTFEGLALAYVNVARLAPKRHKTVGNGRPILLVHGYINDGTVWRLLKRRLEALGIGPIYTVDLGNPFGSIRSYVGKIKEKSEMIAKEQGRSDLILIGHSMGGLVSCLYATQLPDPNPVTDVITIGTPFYGTPVAKIGLGKNAKEMRPGSPLLQEILSGIERSKSIRFHHIASTSDQLVIPGRSAALPQNRHFIYEDIGHASLLYSKRVTNKLYEWLNEIR